ncbi:MAG: flavodoxin family protein [Desulfovibrionaceae bacterium]|nr:flavodoxin family protein [Desulfovibrionaceae bacterium]
MKALAINASARKNGNTALLLRTVLAQLEAASIETEMLELGARPVHGCIACYQCFENRDRRCAVQSDAMNEIIAKMDGADAILLGSPVYFSNVTANMKALIERAGMVARANGDMFARKVGAGVVAVRRAGATRVFDSLNAFFLIGQMIVPGSHYWNVARGLKPGDVADDDEGIQTMEILGRNMAWLLKKLAD